MTAEVQTNSSGLITFVFPNYYQVTSKLASFQAKHSQAKGSQSFLVKHALELFEMVFMLHMIFSFPQSKIKELVQSHYKNYALIEKDHVTVVCDCISTTCTEATFRVQ